MISKERTTKNRKRGGTKDEARNRRGDKGKEREGRGMINRHIRRQKQQVKATGNKEGRREESYKKKVL